MRTIKASVAILAGVALSACGILEVDSPGRIADDDLNAQSAFAGLVAGMAFETSSAVDGTHWNTGMPAGELWHAGSYDFADVPRGIILAEDTDGEWAAMHQARWVAEDGIRRMEEVLGGSNADNPFLAEAALWAAVSNRLLGENLCTTAIDGGGEEPNTVHFARGIGHADRAIQIGQAAGLTDVVAAAYGVRASLKAWQGDWTGAVADASQVPADFVWAAQFTSEVDNDLFFETNNRNEFSVWGTEFEQVLGDPRAPWDTVYNADGTIANGANGSTPFYRQLKYLSLDADIPLVKGTEMLVLRAEAALESADIDGAVALMNEARAEYAMADVAAPASLADAWTTLHVERGATNWLESRRLWDKRRWFAKGAADPGYDSFLEGRDTCFPIGETERRANKNLTPP